MLVAVWALGLCLWVKLSFKYDCITFEASALFCLLNFHIGLLVVNQTRYKFMLFVKDMKCRNFLIGGQATINMIYMFVVYYASFHNGILPKYRELYFSKHHFLYEDAS